MVKIPKSATESFVGAPSPDKRPERRPKMALQLKSPAITGE